MSWYTDPELFIFYWNSSYGYWLARITKTYNVYTDVARLDFSTHLSLGYNKESDYDALKSSIARYSYEANPNYYKCVNCQGLVVYWDYPNKRGTWSRAEESLNSIFVSLPGTINPSDTKLAEKLQALERKNSELVAENSVLKGKLLNNEVTDLKAQVNQEKNAKEAFEKQVIDLTVKLKECRGAGGGSDDQQPWTSGGAVPSHWVPFEELDVLNLPKNTPLTIMEGPSKPKIVEDATTNVQVNRFYRGTFVVGVKVEELSDPGINEKARFDPDIWGLYDNAGIRYAARKPLETEMSLKPPHKTG